MLCNVTNILLSLQCSLSMLPKIILKQSQHVIVQYVQRLSVMEKRIRNWSFKVKYVEADMADCLRVQLTVKQDNI